MRTLGIYLGYSIDQGIQNEGLGRLLGFIINGLRSQPNTRVTVLCPYWLRPSVESLLEDHRIPLECVKIVTSPKPFALTLKEFFHACKLRLLRLTQSSNRSSEFENVNKRLTLERRLRYRLRNRWRELRTNPVPKHRWRNLTRFLVQLAISVVAIVIALPLLLFALVLKAVPRKLRIKIVMVSNQIARRVQKLFFRRPNESKHRKTLRALVAMADLQSDIDAWLIPTPFWPEAQEIRERKVTVCPDVVLHEFSTQFASPSIDGIYNRILKSLQKADHLITYSDYVKNKHLIETVGIKRSRVSVVRHGKVELSKYLCVENKKYLPAVSREIALELLRGFRIGSMDANHFWRNVSFDNNPFVFYSSQYRHHKNILALVKAVEMVNRQLGIGIRLVLTCNMHASERLSAYIANHGLESIVLCAHGIPSNFLAAFNALAVLSVNPSLFEGGFPFTFCEAFSVGTPSIMSDIPVVRELVKNQELCDAMLFDPYNYESIANRIVWGIENREQLLCLQQPLFDAMPDWRDVAGQYLEVALSATEPKLIVPKRGSTTQ